MFRVLALAAAALAVAGCSAPAAAADPIAAPASPTVTTRATGTVDDTPDLLTVDLGVQTRADTATAALDANATAATALLAALRERGVAEADLRTSGLSVGPTYGDAGQITGYEVGNQVTATLRDLAGAGGLIDAVGAAAGDAVRVQGLTFSVDDDGAARAEARADAVRRAQAQATQLADAAGVALGPLLSIVEVPADAAPPTPLAYDTRTEAAATTPVLPGSREVAVTVELVHALGR